MTTSHLPASLPPPHLLEEDVARGARQLAATRPCIHTTPTTRIIIIRSPACLPACRLHPSLPTLELDVVGVRDLQQRLALLRLHLHLLPLHQATTKPTLRTVLPPPAVASSYPALGR